MASIEIRHSDGSTEQRPLLKKQPLAIGSHPSNDVCVPEEDVAVMHCRLSWNGQGFEVAAANVQGVDLNGTLVRHAALRDGDLLRIGSLDIVFLTADAPPEQSASPVSARNEPELKPISADEMPVFRLQSVPPRPVSPPSASAEPVAAPPRGEPEELEVFPSEESYDDLESLPEAEEIFDDEIEEKKPATIPSARRPSRAVRPGERDPLRSPFVLGLGGTVLGLALAAAVVWVMIGRDAAQRQYDAAVADMGQGKYAQAVEHFEAFLERYPRHKYAEAARIGRGKARIEREIAGATPSWRRGLTTLQEFIQEHRDQPKFSELHGDLHRYAVRIATGAASAAESVRERELLDVASEAARLRERYAPDDRTSNEAQRQIAAALRRAEAAVLKQETFDLTAAEIEQALSETKPMGALDARRRLLECYADFADDRRLASLLQRTLDIEKSLIGREEVNREAVTEERPIAEHKALSLALHQRARSDETSEGRTVFALAKDCCYGIDTVTGEPVWRRVVGLDAPFFPLAVSTAVPGLLVFDTRHDELILLDRRTGALVWRQAIGEPLAGPPLVHEGQVYLPTRGNHFHAIDLDSGRITARLRFSQKLHAPPALVADGRRLVIAGDRALLYTLALRSLECEAVSFAGQLPGSLQAPLLPMGRLLLMCENDRAASGRLRVLSARDEDTWLQEIDSLRLEGLVRDAPLLRGNQLFLTSGGQRISAFTVSDEPGQPPLSLVGNAQLTGEYRGESYLAAGPDGRFWLAGGALRRFQLRAGSIKAEPGQLAEGLAAQPLQGIDEILYVGRRLPHSGAVLFIQADRERMTSHWRTVLGSAVIAWSADDGAAVCVSENGDVFRVSETEIEQAGFKRAAVASLRLPESLTDPLGAVPLGDGRLAVWCGPPEPGLWVISRSGQIERHVALAAPLEAAPVELDAGLVLPIPGRLRLARRQPDGTPAEDYLLPIDNDDPDRWVHLAPLDESHLAAVTARGRLLRVEYRAEPSPHLTEVAAVQLDQPTDMPFCAIDGKLFLSDTGNRLRTFDATTLAQLAEAELAAPATNALWTAGDRLLVETGRDRLVCFDTTAAAEPRWSLALAGTSLAGPPLLVGDTLLIARQNGEVWAVDPATGQVRHRTDLETPLTQGPQQIGNLLVVPSLDGSVYRIEPVLTR